MKRWVPGRLTRHRLRDTMHDDLLYFIVHDLACVELHYGLSLSKMLQQKNIHDISSSQEFSVTTTVIGKMGNPSKGINKWSSLQLDVLSGHEERFKHPKMQGLKFVAVRL